MTSEIYGQAHSTIEGQGTSGTLVIKPPKESYQLNQVQVVQSPKLQRLIDNEEIFGDIWRRPHIPPPNISTQSFSNQSDTYSLAVQSID